jgi:Fic family protein
MKNLNNLLDELDRLKAELDKLKPFKREDEERLWKKFRLEWNYNSNHIEGNTLTYGQTELLLIFDKTTGDHDMREYEEMKAHDVAIKLVQEYAADKTRELTEADIRQLNSIILVRPYWGIAQTVDGQQTRKLIEPGVYKREPNSVLLQNGEMFHYASPEETPAKMKALMDWYRKAERDFTLHPVYVAAKMHYDFVRIHPFDDSNGRTSRLLMNYVLLRNGFPPVIIKSSDKKNYLLALNKADVGDFDAFVEYIGEELVWSVSISLKAGRSESVEEIDDLKKEVSVLTKTLKFNSGKAKSPKYIHQVFENFKNNTWKTINEQIKQFDGIFSEMKIFHFANHMPESFEKINILESPFIKSTAPKRVLIFGIDIYEADLEQVEWRLVLYGLKGTSKNPNIELRFELILNTSSYKWKLQVENNSIFELTLNYGDVINDIDSKRMVETLIRSLVDRIKRQTQI